MSSRQAAGDAAVGPTRSRPARLATWLARTAAQSDSLVRDIPKCRGTLLPLEATQRSNRLDADAYATSVEDR
jgi:hypothetical protein